MKIVNSLIPLLILIFSSSCKENKILEKSFKIKNPYNLDSIYYHIDVDGNKVGKELFLITKSITVADSLFGGANDNENWERAWKYMKKKYPEMGCPNFTYSISMYENRRFNEFTSIVYDGRDITYPSLRQGELSNLNSSVLMGKYKKLAVSDFLRIMEINNDNLDTKSINLIYKNKKWTVISKEILNHNYNLEYCIDTTNNDFSLKKMNIHYIFDYPQSKFNCK